MERKYLWQMSIIEIMSDDYAYSQLEKGFGPGELGYIVMLAEAIKRSYPVPKEYILTADPSLAYLFNK